MGGGVKNKTLLNNFKNKNSTVIPSEKLVELSEYVELK